MFPPRPMVVLLALAALPACRARSAPDADTIVPHQETAMPAPPAADPNGLYALDAASLQGEPADLGRYAGHVTLVVNVASACGYTPQYAGLQQLHERLAPRGFAVLGFPSNDFGGQEPGTPAEIRAFCDQRYGVEFPLFAKVTTQEGPAQSPVYQRLQSATGELPNWNFCKYVVDRRGRPVAFFPSKVAPDDPRLLAAIETALADDGSPAR